MKKSLIVLVAAILVLSLIGCTQTSTQSSSTPTSSTESAATSSSTTQAGPPDAKSIWDTTLASGSYKSWSTAPGYETIQPAKGPHGKFVQVYVNPTITTAMSGGAITEWPVGSIVVKDAYDANKAPMQIEYMQKTDQGWYFASYGPDGTVAVEGVKAEPCESCHAKGTDHTISLKLPQ